MSSHRGSAKKKVTAQNHSRNPSESELKPKSRGVIRIRRDMCVSIYTYIRDMNVYIYEFGSLGAHLAKSGLRVGPCSKALAPSEGQASWPQSSLGFSTLSSKP